VNDFNESQYKEIINTVSQIVYKEIAEKTNELEFPGNIPVEVSNRHVHLSQESLEILFGEGYKLNKLRDLSQPGEFACTETIMLISPNKIRTIEKVRILGPLRDYSQVELSFTDGIFLGLNLPIRISGDIKNSESITLVGPKGVHTLKEGAIRAARHIHMTPEDAKKFMVKNYDLVDVEIPGKYGAILKDVVIRVSSESKLALHLDTDEGNAANASNKKMFARII
jgi:putative phosphotransacetylase